jgi:Xaa-Pro dipeptidase
MKTKQPKDRYNDWMSNHSSWKLLCLAAILLMAVGEHGVVSLALRMPPLVSKKQAAAEISCSECKGPIYSLGLKTYRVPMALYELNRARLVQSMLEILMNEQQQQLLQQEKTSSSEKEESSSSLPRGVILLEGGKQTTRYDTDHEPVFRQESYFHWAFGVTDADVYGAISLPSGDATLFIPQYGIDYEIFCGTSPDLEKTCSKYGIENVLPIDELEKFITSELEPTEDGTDDAKLYLLSGLNSDSGNYAMPAHYDGILKHDASNKRNTKTLFEAIAEARVFKTQAEIELMRYTNWVSSMAHVEVMRYVEIGMMEYQLESLFQHYTYTHGGCRLMSYTCICACGPNPAILHYGHSGRPNDRLLKDGDMALLDMGAEYHCYASDITCRYVRRPEYERVVGVGLFFGVVVPFFHST